MEMAQTVALMLAAGIVMTLAQLIYGSIKDKL
jgi:hypothetical protein